MSIQKLESAGRENCLKSKTADAKINHVRKMKNVLDRSKQIKNRLLKKIEGTMIFYYYFFYWTKWMSTDKKKSVCMSKQVENKRAFWWSVNYYWKKK